MKVPDAISAPVRGRQTSGAVNLILTAFLAIGLVLLYGQVLLDLVADWQRDENYSHGLLVPPAIAWLIWMRRADSRQVIARPSYDGVALAGFGLALFVVGQAAVDFFLTRLSLVVLLAGIVVSVRGWQQFRIWLFPLALLALAIPLPTLLLNEVAFPLQLLATRSGVAALDFLAIPAVREGNLILLHGTTLEVAEACSGVRSLISLVTLVLVYGHVGKHGLWVQVALVIAVLPIVIFANGLRVAGAGFVAHAYGPSAAFGFLHTFSGWLFFGLSVFLLVVAEQCATAVARSRGVRSVLRVHQ